MPRTSTTSMAETLQREYGRFLREQTLRAEFLHTQSIHDQLARYEQNKQRNQIDRYQRAVRRITEQPIDDIFTDRFYVAAVPRTERVIRNLDALAPRFVGAGEYGRINNTFIISVTNQEMIDMVTDHIRTRGYEVLDQQANMIRLNYVHDTTNSERLVNLCESNSYWSISSMNYSSAFFVDRVRLMCVGCGVDGGLSI